MSSERPVRRGWNSIAVSYRSVIKSLAAMTVKYFATDRAPLSLAVYIEQTSAAGNLYMILAGQGMYKTSAQIGSAYLIEAKHLGRPMRAGLGKCSAGWMWRMAHA